MVSLERCSESKLEPTDDALHGEQEGPFFSSIQVGLSFPTISSPARRRSRSVHGSHGGNADGTEDQSRTLAHRGYRLLTSGFSAGERRPPVSAYGECVTRGPAAVDARLQSAAAVRLSTAERLRRPKDPTNTIRHIVEVMLREMATLPEAIPWAALLDTS